jgi:two-component system LytT family response regulator
MIIRCLVVDDKPLAIDILADYISKTDFLELAGSTTNPLEALSILRDQHIDLVLLDIQMPQLTGLQFMKIAGNKAKFILTTAYAEYALEGYEHNVVDYLLKPIPYERFYRAAEKALDLLKPPIPDSLPSVSPIVPAEFIFVKTEHRIQKINLSDIIYIEGLQNYVLIQTLTERVISLQTLKKLEEQLPAAQFARVHKSHIVAMRHISAIERSRIIINGTTIPIGDSYRSAFFNRIEPQ